MMPSRSVLLTRTVSFSSGHRYWDDRLDREGNERTFGKWASPYNHGHNYVFQVTAEGPIEPSTGMVVNIKRLDDLLQSAVVDVFDGKSINDEVEGMAGIPPTLENLLGFLRDRISDEDGMIDLELGQGDTGRVRLHSLRLYEMPTLWADWTPQMTTVTRTYEFAASHRLFAPSLSEAENEQLFGKCTRPHGHGHNYVLEVTVTGKPDPVSGMIVDLGKLDETVEREIIERFDHRSIDLDIDAFNTMPSTSENVAAVIFDMLKDTVPARLASVKLHETARSSFEVRADD